jgi:hypothetical protein
MAELFKTFDSQDWAQKFYFLGLFILILIVLAYYGHTR